MCIMLFITDSPGVTQYLINQAPSWNDATKAFVGNNDVRFADINLSEASIRGEPYNPGAGG